MANRSNSLDASIQSVKSQLAVQEYEQPDVFTTQITNLQTKRKHNGHIRDPKGVPDMPNTNNNKQRDTKERTEKRTKKNIPKRYSSIPPIPSVLHNPINKSRPTKRYVMHEGKIFNTITGKQVSKNIFMHGKSGSHQKGRKYNKNVAASLKYRKSK
jgi:hypothetical protein